jgi:predicted acetyltransferase
MNAGINIFVKKRTELSEYEYSQILALCTRVFNRDFAPIMATFNNSTHILLYRSGLLVSHALWVTRWMQYGSLPLLRTAYIEAVVTDEKCRNQGLATQVMKRLTEEIADYDLAALSTLAPRFYQRFGWHSWRGLLRSVQPKE